MVVEVADVGDGSIAATDGDALDDWAHPVSAAAIVTTATKRRTAPSVIRHVIRALDPGDGQIWVNYSGRGVNRTVGARRALTSLKMAEFGPEFVAMMEIAPFVRETFPVRPPALQLA